jgi:hypothetical protein
MKQVLLELPTFGLMVATRAALAAGVVLLTTARLPERKRRMIGTVLVATGAVTTIPFAWAMRRGLKRAHWRSGSQVAQDPSLRGITRFPRKGDDDILPPLWDAADRDELLESLVER